MANFLLPMIRHADSPYELRNSRTGQVIARTVIPALDSGARRKGLLGRDSFPEGSAMIIAPTNAIHTFWMRFAIDLLFVRRDGVVVKVFEGLSPWRAAVAARAYAVVEMPAGTLRRADVRVGDVLGLGFPADGSNPSEERFFPGRLFRADTIVERSKVHDAPEVSRKCAPNPLVAVALLKLRCLVLRARGATEHRVGQ